MRRFDRLRLDGAYLRVCLGVTRDVIDMLDQGKSPREIRAAIDTRYAAQIDMATETPYPPAGLEWTADAPTGWPRRQGASIRSRQGCVDVRRRVA